MSQVQDLSECARTCCIFLLLLTEDATDPWVLPSEVFLVPSPVLETELDPPPLASSPAVVPLYARRILGARESETQTDETSSRPMHCNRYVSSE